MANNNLRLALSSPYFGGTDGPRAVEEKKAKRQKIGAGLLKGVGFAAKGLDFLIPGLGSTVSAVVNTGADALGASSQARSYEANITSANAPTANANYGSIIGNGLMNTASGAMQMIGGAVGGGDKEIIADSEMSGGVDPSIDTTMNFRCGGKFRKMAKGGEVESYHSVSAIDPKDMKKMFSSHKIDIYEVGGDLHSDPSGGTPIAFSSGYKGDTVMAERGELLIHKKDDDSAEGETLYFVTNKNDLSKKYKSQLNKLPKYDYLTASKFADKAMQDNDKYLETVSPKQEVMGDGGNIKPIVTLSPNNYNKIAEGKPTMTPQQYQEHLLKTGNTPVKTYVQGTPYKGMEVKKYGGEVKSKYAVGGPFNVDGTYEPADMQEYYKNTRTLSFDPNSLTGQMSERDFRRAQENTNKFVGNPNLKFTAPMEEENYTASQLVPGASKDRPYYTPTPEMIGDNNFPTEGSQKVNFALESEPNTKDKFFTKENALGITGTATNMAASLYGLLANKPHYVDYSDVLGNYDYKIQQGKEYLQRAKGANNEEIALSSNVNRQAARNTGNYNTMASALASISGADSRARTASNAAYDTQMANYISGTAGQRANIAFQTKSAKDLINTQEYDKFVESNQKNMDRIGSSFKELQLQRNSKITNRQLETLLSKSGYAGADAMVKEMIKVYLKDRYQVEYKAE